MVDLGNVKNKLLAAATAGALDALSKYLTRHASAAGDILIEPGRVIDRVYFPESGLVSSVVPGPVETAIDLIGREGLVGASVLLDVDRTPLKATSQIGGEGYLVPSGAILDAVARSETLRALLSRYLHVAMVQSASTSFANANLTIERRLCRCLLMVRDRLDGDEIELTHETIAAMLNVRRPGLTVATHLLEGRGFIRARRGLITIVDRAGLAALAGASYGLAEAEYDRLLPERRRERAPLHAMA